MDNTELAAEEAAFHEHVQRNFRWNFSISVVEGAFFWLGISFAAPSIIIPLYVSHLTDSRLAIGLIAAISGAGWYLPQLLTANYVERMPLKKPMVVNVGFFSERLAFLAMAVSAFLFASRSPGLALWLVLLTMAWHTLGAGLIAIAWQDMVAKVIPVNYRGRMLGLANFAGNATGMLGAVVAAAILARLPFPTNFALCMLLTFVFVMCSWLLVAQTREPPLHSRKPQIGLREYAQRLPGVLRRDHNFAFYLLSRVTGIFGKMGIGFLTVYAVQRWRLTDSQAGFYTTLLLAGQTVANLLAGVMADRFGHKLVLEISLWLCALGMAVAVWAPGPAWMYLVFAVIGALNAADIVSGIMLPLEFTGPDERPTYIGLANTIPGLFAAVAPILGGWLASRTGYATLFLTASAASLLAWGVLHWMVREPRRGAVEQHR